MLSPFICNAVATKEDRRPRKEKATAASSSSMDIQGDLPPASGADAPAPCNVIVKAEGVGVGARKWLHLSGHQAEVFTCAWNPATKQMASGSADGVCRLWNLSEVAQEKWDEPESHVAIRSAILVHTMYSGERNKDVTAASWSPDGACLATGCYDGMVRLWDNMGCPKRLLTEHQGPVFSAKWNKAGTLLLTAGHDTRANIWDATTGELRFSSKTHALPIMDVDWLDNDTFATCSSDKSIVVHTVSSSEVKSLLGHTSEVNIVAWSPDGVYLASCSDDHTAKIWTVADGLLHDLTGHSKEVYAMRWAPAHVNKPLLLCTASFDGTAKIWNGTQGTLVYTLARHNQPLYSIAPSPDANYVAVGSLGGHVSIWKLSDGSLYREFKGTGDTYDVSWSADGSLLSSCFSSGTIRVVDPYVW